MAIVIRRATGQDKLIRRLQKRILPSDIPLEPSADTAWWIAYDGEKAIGFASITRDSEPEGDFGHLSRSGVDKAYRGHGLQKRLIRSRLAYARRKGWPVVCSDTAWWNAPSSNSLIACGFKTFRPANPWMADGAIYWRKRM